MASERKTRLEFCKSELERCQAYALKLLTPELQNKMTDSDHERITDANNAKIDNLQKEIQVLGQTALFEDDDEE